MRAFGTLPPAAGLTLVSGAGSGQYELRSTWPKAVVVSDRHDQGECGEGEKQALSVHGAGIYRYPAG